MDTKTIVLRRGEQYRKHGYTFELNVPQTVERSVADELLETGSFADFFDTPQNLDDEFGLEARPEQQPLPKNLIDIETDDLNGKRVLLRRLGAIGDTVFVMVFAQWLKSRFPDCSITLAVQSDQIPFARTVDCVDKVIDVAESTTADVIYSFDYLLPFHGVIEDMHPERRNYFDLHWERCGIPAPAPAQLPRLEVSRITGQISAQYEANEILRKAGIDEGDDYVVVLLGTSHPLKRLTKETLQTVVDCLATGGNAALNSEKTSRGSRIKRKSNSAKRIKVVCVGDKNDRVLDMSTQWSTMAVGQSLVASAEIVRRSRLVIGADTGLLHYAAAIGVPTVSLWGPTNPLHTMPNYEAPKLCISAAPAPNQEGDTSVPSDCVTYVDSMFCSPCGWLRAAHCGYFEGGYANCMRGISSEMIVDYAYKLLADCATHPAREVKTDSVKHTTGEKTLPRVVEGKTNVAVLFDVSDHYTGGGFYLWSLVKALASTANFNVHVFYDKSYVIYGDNDPNLPNVRLVNCDDLSKWDGSDMKFDLVVAQPPALGGVATRYAEAHEGCKSMLLVYETPNYIAEYRKGFDTQEEYWAEYRDALLRASSVVCISELVAEKLNEWIPAMATSGVVSVVSPSAYDDISDKLVTDAVFRAPFREDQVVLIARNEGYKKLREALHCAAEVFAMPLNIPLRIIVIGQAAGKLKKFIRDEWRLKGIRVELKESVTEEEKWRILTQSKALIHSSEFEGFGITILEAGLAGTPVICRPLEIFRSCFPEVPEKTYTNNDELAQALNEIFQDWRDMNSGKDVELPYALKRRRAFLKDNYSIVKQGTAVRQALRKIGLVAEKKKKTEAPIAVSGTDVTKVAVITTWNTQCGIAETTKAVMSESRCIYRIFAPFEDSKNLIAEDGDEVRRVWAKQLEPEAANALAQEIIGYSPDVVHIHHEFSFYKDDALFSLIDLLKESGIKVTITLHTYMLSGFTDILEKRVDKIVLTKDGKRIPENYAVINLPCSPVNPRSQREMKAQYGLNASGFVVGSFGFWHPHKGFGELMKAYNDIALACSGATQLYIVGPHTPKSQYASECRRSVIDDIKAGKILMCTDFLPMDEVLSRLAACDVLVYNYNVIAYASASAAIRTGMSSGRPIVCTESPMFSEFKHEQHVLKIPFGHNDKLAEAVARLKNDLTLANHLIVESTKFIQACSAENIAASYDSLFVSVAGK